MRMAQGYQLKARLRLHPLSGPPLQEAGAGLLFLQGLTGSMLGLGNPSCHPGPQIRVEPSERPAGEAAPENQTKDPVAQIPGPETVSVCKEGAPTLELQDSGVLPEVHSDLISEITPSPPVVIATHEENRNPSVDQLGQHTQDTGMATGNDTSVLEPEIEEIPIDDDLGCVFSAVPEP